MVNEMVERVAKALADCAMEPFDELSRSKFEGDARAAIEAMREPTDEMQEAVSETISVDPNPGRIWRNMIDEALTK